MKRKNRNTLIKERIKFEEFLQVHGLQMSAGRQAVFSCAMGIHGHLTAEELASKCLDLYQVSRATVYRTLRELLESDEKPHHQKRKLYANNGVSSDYDFDPGLWVHGGSVGG